MFWTKLLCLCIILPITFTIDSDYYFEYPRRSQVQEPLCNHLHRLYCQMKCGTELSTCVSNRCYCVTIRVKELTPGNSIEDVKNLAKSMTTVEFNGGASTELVSNNHAALRHHIAHFCPNLGDARKCIRECMQSGKPAFCGKDHVCYCGHRYSNTDNDTDYHPKETYAMFKDMYKKYFGVDKE